MELTKLPPDIISRIIPYTYEIHDKLLLKDIIHYHHSKKILLELYHKFWMIDMQSVEIDEDKNWLINDIFAYANNYKATMNGYIDDFYNIFKRNNLLQINENIDKYVLFLLNKKHVSSQINIFLGLLTPKERNDIITFQLINQLFM